MNILTLLKNIIRIFDTSEKSTTTKENVASKGEGDIKYKKDESDYELEYFEGDEGRGFVVRRISDGKRLQWMTLPRSEGFESVPVVGVSKRKKALQDPSFAPGKVLEMHPEPENPHDPNAIGVWNSGKTLQAGYFPKEYAAYIARMGLITSERKFSCMSMWESLDGKKRVGLRTLIIYEGAKIKGISFK